MIPSSDLFTRILTHRKLLCEQYTWIGPEHGLHSKGPGTSSRLDPAQRQHAINSDERNRLRTQYTSCWPIADSPPTGLNGIDDEAALLGTLRIMYSLRRTFSLKTNATAAADVLKLRWYGRLWGSSMYTFINGSAGGSGVDDTVGLPRRTRSIARVLSIKATASRLRRMPVCRNHRQNGFIQRWRSWTLNPGGGTGLAYFRPAGISYEAADLLVHSNHYFRDAHAGGLVVGSTSRVQVSSITFYNPAKWIFRILAGKVRTPVSFSSCANNIFSNHIRPKRPLRSTLTIHHLPPSTYAAICGVQRTPLRVGSGTCALPVAETNGLYAPQPVKLKIFVGWSVQLLVTVEVNQLRFFQSLKITTIRNTKTRPSSIGAVEFQIASVNREEQSSVCVWFILACHFTVPVSALQSMELNHLMTFHNSENHDKCSPLFRQNVPTARGPTTA